MSEPVTFAPKPISWVLDRTGSCFAPTIRNRIKAGEHVGARIFMVGADRFAHVRFSAHPDLVIALEARRCAS